MKHIVVYVHGKGGSPAEAEHYKSLFPDSEVIGLITVRRPRGRPKKNSRRFSLPCASAAAASR